MLGVSRFIPYKRLDAVIQVGEKLGEPVVIAGFGPLEKQLRAMSADASVPVRMLTLPSDAMVRALMGRASLFVFPPIEDFGIVAVEAMAAGTPVMANRVGGAGESVQGGVGGALFDPQSVDEITVGGGDVPQPRPAAHRHSRTAVRWLRVRQSRCSPGSALMSP